MPGTRNGSSSGSSASRAPSGPSGVGEPAAPPSSDEPRQDEYLFEGYELDDALEQANDVLEDDVSVLESDRRSVDVKPFLRKELLGPLERWFFGRSS